MLLWVATLLVALSSTPTSVRADEGISCAGPFTSDELRHPHAHVIRRTATDLLAIPAGVVGWDARDVSLFGATTLAVAGLMLPPRKSLDVRFQRLIANHETRGLSRIFVPIQTIPESIAIAGLGAMLFGVAYLREDTALFEYGSLSLEALAVTQFYHVAAKLLVGREGPYHLGGDGEVHGPTVYLFPGGTPSGHAATAYTLLAVASEYWRSWPVRILGHAAALYLSATLVYAKQHFASDVIFGGALGYAIGRWVVRHRSSRHACSRHGTAGGSLGGGVLFPVLSHRGGLLAWSMPF